MDGAVDGTMKTLAFVVICVAYVKSMRCGRERYQWQFGQVFLQKCLLLKECAYGVLFKKYYACKTEFVVGNESCFTSKTCC